MTQGAKDVTTRALSLEMRGSKNSYWGTEEHEQARGEGVLLLAVLGLECWREREKRGSREEF